jgi:hypothetical protein
MKACTGSENSSELLRVLHSWRYGRRDVVEGNPPIRCKLPPDQSESQFICAEPLTFVLRSLVPGSRRRKAGMLIGPPVLGLTDGTLLQEVSLVFGAEIIAERC